MKAFVMSAGAGTRLRPLTYEVPKPMIPVCNKPVLENTFDLLKLYDIKDIIVNLHAHPEIIQNYFKDGKDFGINLTYSLEETLLGTAGGVGKMREYLDETFIVMSGDGLVDVDISKILDFHKSKKALATIVLKPVDRRFEYGVVFSDENNKIIRFVEKPSWKDVFENRVNTGIYILEPEIFDYIPKDKFYDFGHDVWPAVLAESGIYAYDTDDYWCDIGNLNEYRRAQRDILHGDVKFKFKEKEQQKNIWIGTNTNIAANVDISEYAIIGKDCKINKGVIIGTDTVVGNNCFIDENAELNNCIIWDNVCINKGVKLNNCIIANNAKVSEDIFINEGTIMQIQSE